MSYQVKLAHSFRKSFRKLDFLTQRMISRWIVENLESTDNPRIHGKALTGDFKAYGGTVSAIIG